VHLTDEEDQKEAMMEQPILREQILRQPSIDPRLVRSYSQIQSERNNNPPERQMTR
jgi:hypothetical protein